MEKTISQTLNSQVHVSVLQNLIMCSTFGAIARVHLYDNASPEVRGSQTNLTNFLTTFYWGFHLIVARCGPGPGTDTLEAKGSAFHFQFTKFKLKIFD